MIETIGTALVGAILTIAVTEFLPHKYKVKIRFFVNYWTNRLLRSDFIVKSKLSRGYHLDEPIEIGEMSDELWEIFETRPSGADDHFEFVRDRGGVEYEVDVRLQWESNTDYTAMGGPGEFGMPSAEQEQRMVEHVRISVEGQLPYDKLEKLLFRSYDLLRDVEQSTPGTLSGNAYSLTTETGKPPFLNEFMSRLGFEQVVASDEDGLEIEIRENRVRVRNLNESQVDEAITKIHEMTTLFG